MNDVQRRINKMLADAGFWVLRSNSNLVWTDGKHRLVTPKSSSDNRAYKLIKTELARILSGRPSKQGA